MPAVLLGEAPADAALAVLPDGRPELAVAIPGTHEPWGVLHVVGEARGSLGSRDVEIARVAADALGAVVSGAQRAEEVAHLLHRAEALRRVASDIGSRLDLDRILAGLVDHAMVLFEGDRAAVFIQRDGWQRRGRGEPGTVGRLPRDHPWDPAAVAGGGGRDRSSPDLRGRLPPRPTRRRRPRRGRPGRLRYPVHGAAPRRQRPARVAQRLPRPAASLDARRARHDGRPGDPGRGRHPGRPGLRTDGDLGRAAPVDPAAGGAAQSPVERRRDRPLDRDRAAPADRLPQRAGLPAVRPRPDPGRDDRPGRRVHRRDAGPAPGDPRPGHHGLGRRQPDRPEPRRRGQRPAGQHHPGDRGRPGRVDAPRADAVRRPGPRRAGALQAGPQPVQRRRPPAARDLRELRRPGDGQRRHDGTTARADARAGAAAARPARAAADHRIAR